jgi:hypothetical protein
MIIDKKIVQDNPQLQSKVIAFIANLTSPSAIVLHPKSSLHIRAVREQYLLILFSISLRGKKNGGDKLTEVSGRKGIQI